MRLTWKDAIATVFMAAIVIIYVAFLNSTTGWHAARPSAEVTPRALLKVRGNVRTNLLFRRNAPTCRSPTMPLVPPASLGPDHSTVTRACAGARQNACRWYGDLPPYAVHEAAMLPAQNLPSAARSG